MRSGVIFDIDGTLVDSNDAHADAWVAAFRDEGRLVDRSVVRRSIGMGSDKLLPHVASIEPESELGERLQKRRATIFKEQYFPHLKAFDGAVDLLRALKAKGLVLAVASSASKEDGQATLEKFGFAEFIDEMTCSADAKNSKPSPDIVHVAIHKAKLDPARAIMIGDTPYDAQAALRSGLVAFGFTSGGWARDELSKAGASEIYAGPRELLENLENVIRRCGKN